MKGTSAGSLF